MITTLLVPINGKGFHHSIALGQPNHAVAEVFGWPDTYRIAGHDYTTWQLTVLMARAPEMLNLLNSTIAPYSEMDESDKDIPGWVIDTRDFIGELQAEIAKGG